MNSYSMPLSVLLSPCIFTPVLFCGRGLYGLDLTPLFSLWTHSHLAFIISPVLPPAAPLNLSCLAATLWKYCVKKQQVQVWTSERLLFAGLWGNSPKNIRKAARKFICCYYYWFFTFLLQIYYLGKTCLKLAVKCMNSNTLILMVAKYWL